MLSPADDEVTTFPRADVASVVLQVVPNRRLFIRKAGDPPSERRVGMLLFASVPGGMLVCGTAAGIADALQKGLCQRVLAWVLGASKQQVRTAVGKTLESLFPETNEVLRPAGGAGNARER